MSNRILRICQRPGCENAFFVKPRTVRLGWGKYCSRACTNACATKNLLDRFFGFIGKKEPNGCVFWTGNIDKNTGYGHLGGVLAHRASYELMVGPIPKGLFVLHRCDVNYAVGDATYRRCVHPVHLFVGTQAENIADMIAKDRHCKGTRNGMVRLTEDQVREIRRRWKHGNGQELAYEFGVAQAHISGIITRKKWGWLED